MAEYKTQDEIIQILEKNTESIKLPFLDINGKEAEFDVGSLNKQYIEAQNKGLLNGFGIKAYNKEVYVDLTTGIITIDGVAANLELQDALKQAIADKKAALRFIQFKRHIVSRRIGGGVKDTHFTLIAVGWQTTFNEENYQRFIMIYPDSRVEIKKKR